MRYLLLSVLAVFIVAGSGCQMPKSASGMYGNDPTILGIRGSSFRIKNVEDAYGFQTALVLKGDSSYVLDAGYGFSSMKFKNHEVVSDGEAKITLFDMTVRYYVMGNMPVGLYLGVGTSWCNFSYKIDPKARIQIEEELSMPDDQIYRERIHDVYVPHFEIGFDMPLSDRMEFGIGLRQIDLETKVKKMMPNAVTEKVKMDATVWFFTLSFFF